MAAGRFWVDRFAGRVAIVTGGARGIGNGIAARLHAEGARVVIADWDAAAGEAAAAELNASRPDSARAVRVDVTDAAQAKALVAATLEHFGTVDALAANAGIFRRDPFLTEDESAWGAVLGVNLSGVYLCMREAARRMERGGSIVVTASINSWWMETNMTSYNVSKAGVVGLVRSAALDLAPLGIRVNAVAPGMIRTPMTVRVTDTPEVAAEYLAGVPLGRFGEPADIGAAAAFLLSDDSSWITGAVLTVDGGRTLGSITAGEGGAV